jgi:3-methylcrotonyl-CoA carboxylase alpha subunit
MLDLVEWQLRVAAGEKLPLGQKTIRMQGHAIEARIYAEDPEHEFAPSIGRLALFRTPEPSPDMRVDTGFATGDSVSVHYDAMLAKLICRGDTREAALATLRRALADSAVIGVASNLDLLGRIAAHPGFAAGGVDTGFIARHGDALLAPQQEAPAEVLAAAALCVLMDEAEAARTAAEASADPWSPWHARDLWWLNSVAERALPFEMAGVAHIVSVRPAASGWQFTIGDQQFAARAERLPDGGMDLCIDDAHQHVVALRVGDSVTVRRDGETWRLHLVDPLAAAAEEDDAGGRLVAPIPGQVTQVAAEPGMAVKRGQVLVVLEAMKTVFRLAAPADGVVATVSCRVGDSVEEGQLLVGFAEDDPG